MNAELGWTHIEGFGGGPAFGDARELETGPRCSVEAERAELCGWRAGCIGRALEVGLHLETLDVVSWTHIEGFGGGPAFGDARELETGPRWSVEAERAELCGWPALESYWAVAWALPGGGPSDSIMGLDWNGRRSVRVDGRWPKSC
ncbi:unnamed protein product [Linum trigynum]|uniref:Uncharacterized protein n=1 Tax=Linum trigynum TaxID=586398 RepID=A0AAV2CIA8_9ROSI